MRDGIDFTGIAGLTHRELFGQTRLYLTVDGVSDAEHAKGTMFLKVVRGVWKETESVKKYAPNFIKEVNGINHDEIIREFEPFARYELEKSFSDILLDKGIAIGTFDYYINKDEWESIETTLSIVDENSDLRELLSRNEKEYLVVEFQSNYCSGFNYRVSFVNSIDEVDSDYTLVIDATQAMNIIE